RAGCAGESARRVRLESARQRLTSGERKRERQRKRERKRQRERKRKWKRKRERWWTIRESRSAIRRSRAGEALAVRQAGRKERQRTGQQRRLRQVEPTRTQPSVNGDCPTMRATAFLNDRSRARRLSINRRRCQQCHRGDGLVSGRG